MKRWLQFTNGSGRLVTFEAFDNGEVSVETTNVDRTRSEFFFCAPTEVEALIEFLKRNQNDYKSA